MGSLLTRRWREPNSNHRSRSAHGADGSARSPHSAAVRRCTAARSFTVVVLSGSAGRFWTRVPLSGIAPSTSALSRAGLRRLFAACRQSWGRTRLHRLGGEKGQVRQSATTESWFGSRLRVARRRRAGTRALGDAAAAHYPGHYNSIRRSVRRRRRKADRNRVHAALARPERTLQPNPE